MPAGWRNCFAPHRVKRTSGVMWVSSAFTSTPPPITKPRVVSLASSAGLLVVEVFVTLATTLVTVCVSPLRLSHATPASTNGWTIFPLKRYLARIGNSHEPAVVSILVKFDVRRLLTPLLEL